MVVEKKVAVKKVKNVKPAEKKIEIEEYDATGLVLGRFATHIAQKLLKGIKVNIYNAENTLVTGDPKVIVSEYNQRYNYRAKGNPEKGPKYPKVPHLMLKKAISKMLPPTTRGVVASKNLMVYLGNDNNKKLLSVESAKLKQGSKYIELGELSRRLGAKF